MEIHSKMNIIQDAKQEKQDAKAKRKRRPNIFYKIHSSAIIKENNCSEV